MMKDNIFRTEKEQDRLDSLYKKSMLAIGGLTAFLFVFSLISMIEFPKLFLPVAVAMIASAIAFLILRLIYNFRNKHKVGRK